MASDPDLVIVCIHGLWMNGMDMSLVRRRLRRTLGVNVSQFSYHSVTEGIAENTHRLNNFIDRLQADSVHLVGHSLGGVLALQMLRRFPTDKVNRVVCLGSPLVDSSAAQNFSRWSLGRKMIGRTLREAVLEDPLNASDKYHEVGVIAGTVGLGLGLFVGKLEKPHDGMVTKRETRLPGVTDHLMLPANHIGLLVSRQVAAQAANFLREGKFQRC
jgi:pimeloyl-ACP methyl ester carboxylesterase